MFCINHVINEFFSVYILLDFALDFEIHYNFESYQNMLTTLGFNFLYHKLQLCFICHVHYTPFTHGKIILKI
jgi:hypothetical protein